MSDWKEVNSSTDEVWDRTGFVQGIYEGFKDGIGPNNSKMYQVRTKEDTLIGVWGSTVLDTKMEAVKEGFEIRIEEPVEKKGKNGKTYMDFKVMYRPAPFQESKSEVDIEEIDF